MGLGVNVNKTEYMCIGGLSQDLILQDTQQRIKLCNKYKYLAMYITNDGTTDEAIRDRTSRDVEPSTF